MRRIMCRAVEAVEIERVTDADGEAASAVEELLAQCKDIHQRSQQRHKVKPVSQQSMAAGEVELF